MINSKVFVIFIVLLSVTHGLYLDRQEVITSGFYLDSEDIFELTTNSFNQQVTENDIWIVQFYYSWCDTAADYMPTYKNIAKVLKGLVQFGAIDAELYRETSHKYGVISSPTLILFSNGKDYYVNLTYSHEPNYVTSVAIGTIVFKTQLRYKEIFKENLSNI